MTETLLRPDTVETARIETALRALRDDAEPRCFRLTDMPEIRDVMVCPKPKGHLDPCGLLGRKRVPAHLIDALGTLLSEHDPDRCVADCAHQAAAAAITAPYAGWTP
ncbi:hypothetical protein [Nocardioides pakistanensis]